MEDRPPSKQGGNNPIVSQDSARQLINQNNINANFNQMPQIQNSVSSI
jgi:hypothetical protein